MPRDSGGVYSLPSGNPVVTGTVIESSWANTTMDDISVALTDSLSRTGSGGMLVAIKEANGTVSNPSYTFTNAPTYGMWLSATDDELNFSAGATKVIGVKTAGVTVTGTTALNGNTSVTGTFGVSGAATLPAITGPTEVTGDLNVTGSLTVGGVAADAFPAGTRLIFPQASAPTGWTKLVFAGYGIQLTSGTDGGDFAGISDAFAAHTHSTPNHAHGDTFSAAGTAISVAQMPAHTHSLPNVVQIAGGGSAYSGGSFGPGATATGSEGSGQTHTHTINGAVSSGGASTTGAFTPKYVKAIACEKD